MLDKSNKLNYLLTDYKSNVVEIWDLRAYEIYTRWNNEKGDYEALAEVLNNINQYSLLDMGYGYGRLAPLYTKIPHVVGMDISQRMLELSTKKNIVNHKIKTILGDIRRMPFNDGCFTCLISVRTLNHIHPDNILEVEQEISRVCSDVAILLESDVKLPGAKYEFEHDYDKILQNAFVQTKKRLDENVYLRIFHRKVTV